MVTDIVLDAPNADRRLVPSQILFHYVEPRFKVGIRAGIVPDI